MKLSFPTPLTQSPYLILWLVVLVLSGCDQANKPLVNHRQPLLSPSGRYVLTVPIEENSVNPAYNQTKVWKITISDTEGRMLYTDEASEFVGYLMVYWLWDREDRVWLYTSDTGDVFYWELDDKGWTKLKWEEGTGLEKEDDLVPPAALYPSYLK